MQTAAGLLAAYYCAAVGFLRRGLMRLGGAGAPGTYSFSVIIAAHNEEARIGECLSSVLQQTIATDRYEIIVADDRSTDQTASVVEAFASRHVNVRLIPIPETPSGIGPKKHALQTAIAAARNDIIVFTDADCRVLPTWLETIDCHIDERTGLVQGVTRYERPPGMGRLFFGLQALDFLSHGVVAAAAIGAGFPLNSNANNLAFRRTAFEDAGGYGEHSRLISGDDDLLVQRIWKSSRWRIRYMTDPAGAVVTEPTPTMRGVFEQRKRWASKTVHYNRGQTLFLSGIFLFYVMIALSGAAALISRRARRLFILLIAAKISGEYLLMSPGMRLFGQDRLKLFIMPASIIQLPVVIAAILRGIFGRFEWKTAFYAREVRVTKRSERFCR